MQHTINLWPTNPQYNFNKQVEKVELTIQTDYNKALEVFASLCESLEPLGIDVEMWSSK